MNHPLLEITHHTVQAGEMARHCAEAGSGESLVHGFPQQWWMWRGVMPALAQ